MKALPFGDMALVLEFGDQIDPAINAQVQQLAAGFEALALKGVRDIVPTFRSLCLHFDPLLTDHETLEQHARRLAAGSSQSVATGKRFVFPFLVSEAHSPDLAELSALTGLSERQVIESFCAHDLTAYFLGFVPGNAFLGQLDPSLFVSRRAEPRVRIPPGSVATAMGLGMIYPLESPGGWHLIGHSPVPLFDLGWDQPALLAPGDQVRFQTVDAQAHAALSDKLVAGMPREAVEALLT